MLLKVEGLTRYFGGLAAVHQLDMHINEGEIVGLMGPNGAGKTTVFNLITGVLQASSGSVLFGGRNITGKKPHAVARLGIARTFQFAYLFPDFSVLDNVMASFHLYPRSGFWEALFNTSSYRKKEKYIFEHAMEILKLVGLEEVKDVLGKNLPYGYQKLLTMARALAIKPKLLLLDEPTGGMYFEEMNLAISVIKRIRLQGTSIMLVEHNMKMMKLCDRLTVMNFGRKIAEGSVDEVRQEREVIKAYFGHEYAA